MIDGRVVSKLPRMNVAWAAQESGRATDVEVNAVVSCWKFMIVLMIAAFGYREKWERR